MLQTSTLAFLKKLEKNNHKNWFDENRYLYVDAKSDFEQLVSKVIDSLGKVDGDIATLLSKNCMFRQNRDIRFSKDKTPYKTHFGASFDRGGRKSGFAGYYLHIEPGNRSFAGGGIWMPDAPVLKKIRQEIDYNWEEFNSILQYKDFKKVFGDLEINEYKLSREPKGYEKDNPAIEYLKLKSLVAIRKITDEELVSKKLGNDVVVAFSALMPLVKFINRAVE